MPFNRYYLEEIKAQAAENAYRDAQQDSRDSTYALVAIKNGSAVLADVIIDGMPILEYLKKEDAK